MNALLLAALLALFPVASPADEPIASVAVGQAKVKHTTAAFPLIQSAPDAASKLAAVRDIAIADLDFSGLFDFLKTEAFLEPTTAGISPGTFKMSDWSAINAELLIKTKGELSEKGVKLDLRVYGVQAEKTLLAKSYDVRETKPEALRKLAHVVSSDVMLALTGKKGPFTSRIAFVSDKSGRKEIYVMDFDGHNPVRVTPGFLMAISPAWRPDGKAIVFTGDTKNAKGVRNHNLFLYNLPTGRTEMISNRTGLNSGAVFSPDGKQLALTMSFTGHASIYVMDNDSKAVRRLTNSYGLDVDPAWSPDGKQLAFVSDRGGKSMVYKIGADGSNAQRLTYAGDYNASPSWSPAGNKIAFGGWDGHAVDIYLMDTDGSNIERLTKDVGGHNESPDFAPDGYFLAYSSDRGGKRNIFITNIDNTVHRQVTKDFGNCESPRWSN